ncbi:MAG: flagellar FliJ family protein [Planctomycetes bacterium]|nr:flagellar FliJ family protein [Planctomycetota bacterium]
MYETYRDIAEFRIVYIHEAHAADSGWSNKFAESKNITEHKTYGQRCSTAQMLVDDKNLTIPTIIDGMDNATSEAYQAHPDRIYLVGKDGKLGVAGRRGPRGFEPGLRTVEKWLAEYKKTGVEPDIVDSDDTEDLGDLEADLMAAHRAGEYDKALDIAGRMHELDPHDVSTLYNMACLHCLLNDGDKAYTRLEQAIENGYQDADHLAGDDDFKSLRGDDRFKRLVERVRQADLVVEERRGELLEATKERRVFEILRERSEEAHRREGRRQERILLDEVGQQLHTRKGSEAVERRNEKVESREW